MNDEVVKLSLFMMEGYANGTRDFVWSVCSPSVVLLFCVLGQNCVSLLGDYNQLQCRVSP